MISFVIPAYNAEEYIENCIKSILGQKGQNPLEILVVDDGSTDRTGEKVQRLAEKNPEILYLYKENGGVSSARNEGLRHCRGEFVAFADADDSLEPDFVRSMVENIKGCDWCVCGYYQTDSTGKTAVKAYGSGEITGEMLKTSFDALYGDYFFHPVWNKLYRRELIRTEFDENRSLGEDLAFNLEYLKNCKKIRVTDRPLYKYQLHGTSATQKYRRTAVEDFEAAFAAAGEYCSYAGLPLSSAAFELFANDVAASVQRLTAEEGMSYREKREEYKKLRTVVQKKRYFRLKKGSRVNRIVYAYLPHGRWFLPLFLFLRAVRKIKKDML